MVLFCGTYSRDIHKQMAASLHRLRTRQNRLQAEQGERLRQLMLSLDGLPQEPVSKILAAIDATTMSANGWTFVMLSPTDNARVVRWLSENSKTPMVGMRLWAELFLQLNRDTGEITQTRDELAEAVGVAPRDVSRVMGELESFGAIQRQRVKVAGMRGPGVVRYFMNPRIATHVSGRARDKAQAEAPLLRLVER